MTVRNERGWGFAGVAGFCVALAVHILTTGGVDVASRVPYIWAMHAVVLLYWISLFFFIPQVFVRDRQFDTWRDNLPGWVLLADALFSAYAIMNFVLCMSLTGGGNAEIVNGQHLLTSHAHVLAHLTEREYHLQKAYDLRGFSGVWIVFWFFAATSFLFWKHIPVRSTDRLLA